MAEQHNIEAFPGSKAGAVTNTVQQLRPRKWWQFGGQDISHVSIDAGYETSHSSTSSSSLEDTINKNEGVFVAPEALDVYKPVEGFEGAHRFDPSATWSAEDEKRLVSKVCFNYIPKLCNPG